MTPRTAPVTRLLDAWAGIQLLDVLHGGARNPVYRARRGSDEVVVRVSSRRRSTRRPSGLRRVAWEVATCWTIEPAYAQRRLYELLATTDQDQASRAA